MKNVATIATRPAKTPETTAISGNPKKKFQLTIRPLRTPRQSQPAIGHTKLNAMKRILPRLDRSFRAMAMVPATTKQDVASARRAPHFAASTTDWSV